MLIMWKVIRIPAGDITDVHYKFLVALAKPLVLEKLLGTKYSFFKITTIYLQGNSSQNKEISLFFLLFHFS